MRTPLRSRPTESTGREWGQSEPRLAPSHGAHRVGWSRDSGACAQARLETDHAPFDMFQWISPEAQAAFAGHGHRKRFAEGQTIYMQGEPGAEMFRVMSGAVRLSVISQEGRELLYLLFEPGDCFGISTVVDGEARPHTAEAQLDVELMSLSRSAFNTLRAEFPEVNDAAMRLIARHMRMLSEYFANSNLEQIELRVAARIVEAARSFGQLAPDGIRLSIHLPQNDLALMVGASRQSVNKVLQQFQDSGVLTIEYGTMIIRDLDRLHQLASSGRPLRGFLTSI